MFYSSRAGKNQTKILITGASGFIGRSLVVHLLKRGHNIISVSRSPTGFNNSMNSASVESINSETDLCDKLIEVSTIIHLAARVHEMRDRSVDVLEAYRLVNVEGTRGLAEQAARAGVKHFIFLSTVKVYGSCSEPLRPFTHESKTKPMDAYSQSKLEAEQALRAIEKTTDMTVTIIRSPLVYGPGVRANFLEMMRWISLGIPLPFGALTSNLRSFVGINNLTDFIAVCVNNSKAAGQTFLVSDGKDISTVELIRLVAHAMGKKEKLFNVPVWLLEIITKLVNRTKEFERLSDSLQVDISYSVDRLNWVPVEPLDQAIRHAVQSFRR